ncbi:VanW family protein [Candidatus Gracilibacteria bacterium]|nr:VanW family protein [Candidatus Gracilibacteria bacterium]
MKGIIKVSLAVVSVLVAVFLMLVFDLYKKQNLVIPRTVFGNTNLDGRTREQARLFVNAALENLQQTPVTLAARGTAVDVPLSEFHIAFNEDAILDDISFAGEVSNVQLLGQSFLGKRVMPQVHVSESEVARVIDTTFPDVPKNRNAHFVKNKGKLEVVEAQTGLTPRVAEVAAELEKNIQFLETSPIMVEFDESQPTVWKADLDAQRGVIEAALPTEVSLVHEKKKWKLDFKLNPDWIEFSRDESGSLNMAMSPITFSDFVSKEISPQLEQQPESVRITRDEKGAVQFEGQGRDGQVINREQLIASVNEAFTSEQKTTEIPVPLETVPAKIEIPQDLQDMGIKELVSVGYSRFEGSPANRAHNIDVGIKKFNGLLIAPGAEFSFGDNLGPVDGTTGYKKELVIKPEGTIPEYGGGICQVSSTLYRGILRAGLPVTKRSPHSYAVSYYAQVDGYGLDATVYPPQVDLKFVNDTPAYLLIQSYVDGPAAYFKFYGTKDGREVTLDGPYITNKRGIPALPLTVYDPNLKPGQSKQLEKPHAGFDATWYRTIKKDGAEKKEEIFSRYKAMPSKVATGDKPAPAEAAAVPAVNPFE